MTGVTSELRAACAAVAERASRVRIAHEAVSPYAARLPLDEGGAGTLGEPELAAHLVGGSPEELAAFWVTLDAINFGSGWFPTLRKRKGRSGYLTIASAVRDRFAKSGPWDAAKLAEIQADEVARALGQDPEHELMALFARSLRDMGAHVAGEHSGSFLAVAREARGSAVVLAELVARWAAFSDTSSYGDVSVPFLKRAQILAADLDRAKVVRFSDIDQLTMFADNLVPHVLRLDGVLELEPALATRIERGELIEHDSPEEVELRACALQAVELIVAARPGARAADVDQLLWLRGQGARYKSRPRHRTRCTAY